jgi:phosphoribosyl 1,2-cyclic phosphate phosphodiesterase
LDAVLYTHAHADHLHGIDDLREINRAMRAPIPVYATAQTLAEIDHRFDYVFTPLDLESSTIYKPWLLPNAIESNFSAAGIAITAFDQDHGYSRTTGFRIGDFAYSTDVLDLPEDSMAKLQGLDLWIVGCLVDKPHVTHADIDKALRWRDILKPRRLVITHMSTSLDYAALAARLPEGVEPAFDGMVLAL